jgi:two-component system, cell cycle response regulator
MTRPSALIIDDDPFSRSLLATMLRKDFQVALASGGHEGLVLAQQRPPQLILLDMQMPDWDGLKTLAKLREVEALANIPVIMITNDSSRETVAAAVSNGVNDFLLKSALSQNELLKRAARLMRLATAVPA